MKPSDFPREDKFIDPTTPPFRDADGIYHVLSYADVMAVLMNRGDVISRDPAPWLPDRGPVHMAFDFMWMIEPFTLDGEEGRHGPLRRVVEPWFRSRAIVTMEPLIRNTIVAGINDVIAKGTGEVDVATELSTRLSMQVICRLIGIEFEREQWMRAKLDEFNQATFDKIPPQWDVQTYFWQLIAKRVSHPGDELLDVIIKAWENGTIDDRELVGYMYGFAAAGTDTTGASLANTFTLLAEFELLEYAGTILGDGDGMEKLIEEILRFGTPFPMKPLYVRKEAHFGELTVPEGSVLTIWFSAANRDEAVNGGVPQSDPNTFDPTRWPNKHVALGRGKHYCLGKDLAKLEMRILLEEALRRLPGLQMDWTKPFRRYPGIVHSVTEAHFTFDQERAARIRDTGREAAPVV